MKVRIILLIVLAGIFGLSLLWAEDQFEPVEKPTFLTPDEIDPYAFQIHLGDVAPPSGYTLSGDAAYKQQQYEDAARYYLAHLQYEPTNRNVLYNLSRCYGFLNRPDLAAKYVTLAYQCGFTNVNRISKDVAFKNVRNSPAFKTTLDSLQVVNKKENY